jgi:iron complex outermembrane receptor protein
MRGVRPSSWACPCIIPTPPGVASVDAHVFTLRRRSMAALACGRAGAAEKVTPFDLPAEPAERSLQRLARQGDVEVVFSTEVAAGIRTNAVKGDLAPLDAARRLLAGTNLEASQKDVAAAIVITRRSPATSGESAAKKAERAAPETVRDDRPAPVNASRDDAPIELSPFVVQTDKDVGYLAANTAAGSRLNTALIDTPASISELTKEFLTDINANNTMDAVEFSLGFQIDRPAGNDNLSQFQSQTAIARGLGRNNTVSRDYFPWSLSDDAFSIERLSESRGPNAILFGIGAAGGIINTTAKRALFRETASWGLKLDDHGSRRGTVDVNHKLSSTLALRLNALKEDNRTWRDVERVGSERIHLAGTWRPLKRTEIRVEYERGIQNRVIGRRFSGWNFLTPYRNAGSPTYNRAVSGNVYPTGISALATTPRLVYENEAGAWANWQRYGVGTPPATTLVMADETYLPFSAVLAGPTGISDNSMFTGTVVVQQEVAKNLFVEIGLNESATRRLVNSPVNQIDQGLRIDPNVTAPLGAAHTGQYYVESSARYDYNTGENHNRRALGTYEWPSGNRWIGTHRFVSLATQSITEGRGRFWLETNLTPLNPAVPALTNAQNLIYRRTYLSRAGVFGDNGRRFFDQNPFAGNGAAVPFRDAANNLTGTITPGWVLNSDTPTRNDNRSLMAAGQSRILRERLVLTWGLRRDTLDTQTQVNTRDLASNAIVQTVLGPKARFEGTTRTVGAVVPVFRWFSLYANEADNFSPQSALDINRNNVGNVKGTGRDYGIKINLSENRLYFRAGTYESAATNQSRLVFNSTNWIRQIWEAIEGTTGAHYTTIDPTNNVFDTSDTVAKGLEFELTANPVKGLSFTANYATLRVESTNNTPTQSAYIAQYLPQWTAANPNLPVPSVAGRTLGVALANLNTVTAQDLAQNGREATGNYRYSLNFIGRYQFQSGALKGWGLGTGYRHRDGRIVNYTVTQDKIWAPSYGLASAFVDYRQRIWQRKINMTVRLNVANALNNRDHIVASTDATGTVITGYSFQDPRLFTLSVEFGF